MKFIRSIIVPILGALCIVSIAWASQENTSYMGSEAFEQLKQLSGLWEGSMDTGQGPQKIMARYKITSGGSAIVETVFKGMPHEMVTVYHDNPDRRSP